MLRVLVAALLACLLTLAFGVPVLLAGALDRSGGLAEALVRIWSRLVLRACRVAVDVRGAEHVAAGPAVYAANHGSAIDIPILFGYLPVSFRIIHKRSLYRLPIVGWHLWLARHIGVDRGNPWKARRSLAAAAERIRSGTSVAVFPEGTRSPDAGVRLFKRGSFLLAIQAGVPVVPVSLAGVKRVIPRGWLTLRPGRVVMTIHAPLATAGRSPEQAEALAEETREIVRAGCEEA